MDLDRYIPRHSSVHRADPRLKVVLTAAAVLGIALLPVGAFWAFAIVWLVLVGASAFAHLGPLRLVRGSWVVLPFVIVALVVVGLIDLLRRRQTRGSHGLTLAKAGLLALFQLSGLRIDVTSRNSESVRLWFV